MDVVRRDQADSEVLGDFWQNRVAPLLFFKSVIVEFDEEILFAENIAILRGGCGGFLNVVRLDRGVHFSRQTAAEANQSRRVLREQLFVDSRPVVKTIEMRGSDQFYEIAIAHLIFGQQGKV